MITIIFGKPRSGKTALMTALLSEEMYNVERIRSSKKLIKQLNDGGFNLEYPNYIACANYNVSAHRFGYSPRQAKRINPYHIGFANDNVSTYFLPPYSIIGIMEAQKYYNSRRFKDFPDWVSRFFEMHGHYHLDFVMDTQRPGLIDVNIRELATFVEILDMRIKKDSVCWDLRYIDGNSELDVYFASGKKDKDVYKDYEYETPIDTLDFYNTRENQPLFFDGHFNDNFSGLNFWEPDKTYDDYIKFCKNNADGVPDKFYLNKVK